MEKNYRIHTNISSDTVLNVNMSQDYEFLEILTMKLRQVDAYRLHSSNYGVIIGRVLANDAFGIPNARISVFIERDTNDPTYMESIYPYKEVTDRDNDGRRYNLLPSDSNNDCYRIVGTFPSKRLVLDDNVQLEIFDKYYKFTTVTNNAGDYMLFGVPSGSQQIHIDLDLSDIGILSQSPRDFEHKGYSMTMFDSPSQFKESTNLDWLAQLFSQNKSVFVYPFWGDAELGNGIAAITRCDVQIQYKFEPTCVFMGSIISDNEGNSIGHKCSPSEDNGMNSQLIAGEGTIEMIRKTPDGLVEEYSIQGNQLIDTNGVWCYQIPMNLDFVGTDEYGNIVPTDNPNKGIPTRTQVRFRFSKNETGDEGHSRHTAKYLVPMNPTLVDKQPTTVENKEYIEKMYTFGSSTPNDCFRDLYWNNVYSVKNFIPKTQVAHRPHSPNYTGLKGSNLVDDQNPVPFNKLRIDIPFMYAVVCIIFQILIIVVTLVNYLMSFLYYIVHLFCIPWPIDWCPFESLFGLLGIEFTCVSLGAGLSDDNTAYYPGCWRKAMNASSCPTDMENCKKSSDSSDLINLVQQKLAQDYKIVKLDFYQDWLNGSLYMPLWYWRKRKKKTFLFWTISGAKNEYCDCNKSYSRMKTYVTCNFLYNNRRLKLNSGNVPEQEDKWHRGKSRAGMIGFSHGLIKSVENKDGLTAYYYTAIHPTSDGEENERLGNTFKAVRLFATDIILLGNLKEDNLYGLPQFFKCLPSTTANIPPIATVYDSADEDSESDSKNTLADSGDTSGPSMTTGMDWVGGGGNPRYKNGLFMDLACTYADTKAKSCINVERLSELGMNLDMAYDVSYPTSSGLQIGTFETDGLITKYELDDVENRAMFATMNHLGFVPQIYQNKLNGYSSNPNDFKFYTTQVKDENTNYYIPKFKYLYPTDLDGRMQVIVNRYCSSFKQVVSDDADESYINFRLGDVQGTTSHTGDGQFYLTNTSMPLYNNSFYFYFGVKKGNTAIEKFNKMFYAECFKNSKYPFTLDINSRALSYCPSAYKKEEDGISFIEFASDDIEMPYTYRLYDSNGNIVSYGVDLETNETKITEDLTNSSYLGNQAYTLVITDNNGRSITQRVRLEMPKITATMETRPLGTKYYDDEDPSTQRDKICTHYYGVIEFSEIYIDSYRFTITDVEYSVQTKTVGDRSYEIVKLKVSGENSTFKNDYTHIANIEVSVSAEEGEETPNITDYLCNDFFYRNEEDGKIVSFGLRVFRPSTFITKTIQICDGSEMNDSGNVTTQGAVVENGENFYAYLNNMPIEFFASKVYPPAIEGETQIKNQLINWVNICDPSIYEFPPFTKNRKWQDFIDFIDASDEGSDSYNKQNVLLYKFNRIFGLSQATYVTGNGDNNTFKYTATGGIQPLLYRSVVPYYEDNENVLNAFKYSDKNSVIINSAFPNIVGDNYLDGKQGNGVRMNNLYRTKTTNGNYFGVFSNNGRYTSEYGGDCSIYSESIPTDATVNVRDRWKVLGEDEELLSIPELVYSDGTDICSNTTKPYFRALFVDRRLDYELTILGPFEDNNVTDDTDISKIGLLGYFYNGIEFAYDDNYNIINNETNGELEYSYSIDSDINISLNPNTKIKRYYSVNIGGVEVKDYLLSTENNEFQSGLTEDGRAFIYNRKNLSGVNVNGWFDANNYPTRRYIDVRKFSPLLYFPLNVVSCSYSIGLEYNDVVNTEENESGGTNETDSFTLNSYINEGESLDTVIKFNQVLAPVKIDSKCLPKVNWLKGHNMEVDFGDFIYSKGDNNALSASEINCTLSHIGFISEYNSPNNDDFGTYVSVPRFINKGKINQIKNAVSSTEIEEIWQSLPMAYKNIATNSTNEDDYNAYDYDSEGYIRESGTRINADGAAISSVQINCGKLTVDILDGKPVYIYQYDDNTFPSSVLDGYIENDHIGLCYKRQYVPMNTTNLKRSITTYEFTNFYYCGDITITYDIVSGGTYTILTYFGVTTITIPKVSNFKINSPTSISGSNVSFVLVLKTDDDYSRKIVVSVQYVGNDTDWDGFNEQVGEAAEFIRSNFGSALRLYDLIAYITSEDGVRYKIRLRSGSLVDDF